MLGETLKEIDDEVQRLEGALRGLAKLEADGQRTGDSGDKNADPGRSSKRPSGSTRPSNQSTGSSTRSSKEHMTSR